MPPQRVGVGGACFPWSAQGQGALLSSSTNMTSVHAPSVDLGRRLYNQPYDQVTGKGQYYKGFWDCFSKTVRVEGLSGLYKVTNARTLSL